MIHICIEHICKLYKNGPSTSQWWFSFKFQNFSLYSSYYFRNQQYINSCKGACEYGTLYTSLFTFLPLVLQLLWIKKKLDRMRVEYKWGLFLRWKLLDLIDRVPDELWMEVCDIVQETGIKTIPMEKKCKKTKWLSGEALQIAVKRREVKSKGEKEW